MPRLIIYIILIFPLFANGQNLTDSLFYLLHTKPVKEHAEIYNNIAALQFEHEQYKESYGQARKALVLAKKFNNTEEEYNALMNIAYIKFDLGDIDSSIFFGQIAFSLAKQTGKTALVARVCNHLGSSYKKISLYDKSLHYYFKSLKIIEDTLPEISWNKNQYYKSLVFNNIGTVYKNLGQAEKALGYYRKSLAIRRELNDSSGIATCIQNIGVYYYDTGIYDSTLKLYKEALSIRRSLKQPGYAAELLLNLGQVYAKIKEYDLSEEYLNQAVKILESLDKKGTLSYAYLSMGELYLNIAQPEKAYYYIEKARLLSIRQHFKNNEKNAYKLLADYYYFQHDYKKALECRERQIELADTIYNSEMTSKVAEMETKYEIEKKEKEIEILSKDNEIQSLKIRRKTTQVYFLIILIFLFILLLMITILLLNRRQLKQKQIKADLEKSKLMESRLKEENEYQSKQLTTHALNILQKNKLLAAFDTELMSFLPSANVDLQNTISHFRRLVNRSMKSEKDWDLFKLYFEEVNRTFYSTLQSNYKDLTPGDLKLAALIKLNLNIKEAAAVLNVAPDSLKKARYRLRCKLGLNDRENLADFLNKI